MLKLRAWMVCGLVLAVAAGARAQDSVSKTGCFPGDATSPWADDSNFFGSEQEDAFVVDLAEFQTSWSTTFGVAPVLKSSKTSSTFFSSLISSQSISRRQLVNVPFPSPTYKVWNTGGFGVNNNSSLNDFPGSVETVGLLSNQFAAAFAEFATTDAGASYNGIIGGLVNRTAADPGRLYVLRNVMAVNGCVESAAYSEIGFGTIDADGYMHFRSDCFSCPPTNPCELTPVIDDNIFQVSIRDRSSGVLNVISNDYPGGLFDAPATKWIVRNSPVTMLTPGTLPASMTGGDPVMLGVNFDAQFVRGSDFQNVVSDQSHWTGTDVIDQRGSVGYSSHACEILENSAGVAGILARRPGLPCEDGECTDRILVWGLDTAGNPTGNLVLQLPTTVTDNATGFQNLVEPGVPNQFNNYQSQTAFRGGNSQVAIGSDPAGNMLVAASVDHPFTPWQIPEVETEWDLNYIAVARINCDTGNVDWTMAGYNTVGLQGKPILDGPGGTPIGRMRPVNGDGTGGGPAISSPMIDAGGNIWFISTIETNDDPGFYTRALLRAVYFPNDFHYELELVLKFDDVFHGPNSDLDYAITFIDLNDSNSIASGTVFSQNISEDAHMGIDPSTLAVGDPAALGGLVMRAEITYDYDGDGDYEDCAGGTGVDQDYNVLLFIGSVADVAGCATADDCDDANVCTSNVCDGNICRGIQRDYGDLNSDAAVDVLDVVCGLDGSQDEFSAGCAASNADVFPCESDGAVDDADVEATVGAIQGVDLCCALPSGACCVQGQCQDDVTGPDCFNLLGDYQGDGSTCEDVICPAIGACCVAASCLNGVSQPSCLNQGGVFYGPGTACDGILCDPVGACCVQGLCDDGRTADQCDGEDGAYLGDNTSCDTSECPRGACCLAGSCIPDSLEYECIGQDGEYQGDNSDCGSVTCPLPPQVYINEVRIDQPGNDDDEYFELYGDPGASLNGLTYIVIGDGVGGSGVIEAIVSLNGLTIPEDGVLLVGEPSMTLATPDATASLNFENSDNVTHLVVAGFTGLFNQDLDENDDGVLESPQPWLFDIDRIALVEQPNPPTDTEWHYGPPMVGPDQTFVPGHAFRCPDGEFGIWVIGPFDPAIGNDTPGSINFCVNAPQDDQPGTIPADVTAERMAEDETVQAGGPVISLLPRGGSGSSINVAPGEVVTIDAYLTDSGGLTLRGYQVSLPAAAGGGDALTHALTEPVVNTGQASYLFVGVSPVEAFGALDGLPRVASAVFDEDAVAAAANRYLGEFTYEVAVDADGSVQLTAVDASQAVTGVVTQDGNFVPAQVVAASINVEGCIAHDADCNGTITASDHLSYTGCETGPDGDVASGCDIHDADSDGDVDLRDWRVLMNTFGPQN